MEDNEGEAGGGKKDDVNESAAIQPGVQWQ